MLGLPKKELPHYLPNDVAIIWQHVVSFYIKLLINNVFAMLFGKLFLVILALLHSYSLGQATPVFGKFLINGIAPTQRTAIPSI